MPATRTASPREAAADPCPPADPIGTDARLSARATRAALARRASGRRRFVDPTTCERDYSAAELEFLAAIQQYKLASGRNFPTWSEVLEVVRSLGYEKSGRGD
jgi:hypothetical protein